ncbi:hypothetical protein ACERK3_16335 [Phycisphaerales bacterium AB-hyl4]|uniref:Uncharacterized protein n=1 Tax=Natronomicrosphaera hydrolytica TaxID=3242702 RepID=A0ABV4U8B0_9BACT
MSNGNYPPYLLATLVDIGGVSCSNLHHRLGYVLDSDPPEYREVPNEGDFAYCRLRQISSSTATSWDLLIYVMGPTCTGLWEFRREVTADDPTGAFCRWANNVLDCGNGKANVVDDS